MTVPDQWQVQVQARVQSRARVLVHTDGLTAAELAEAHLERTADVAATVRAALDAAGPAARVCVLPEGPQTIPYLPADVREDDELLRLGPPGRERPAVLDRDGRLLDLSAVVADIDGRLLGGGLDRVSDAVASRHAPAGGRHPVPGSGRRSPASARSSASG